MNTKKPIKIYLTDEIKKDPEVDEIINPKTEES